jgi:NAD(P)H-hydrate epimerase
MTFIVTTLHPTATLPLSIHTAEQVRSLDRYAIDTLHVPGYTLMTRAGEAAFRELRQAWPEARRVIVVCGPGNNGGDGYVLARVAREHQLDVVAISLCDTAQLRGDAARACRDFVSGGGTVREWSDALLERADVIVDAIFGTGLSRAVDATIAAHVCTINDSKAAVFALDIPSGLHADSGAVLGTAIHATRTLTFIGLKVGFYLGSGPDCVGTVIFDALDLPASALEQAPRAASRIGEELLARTLPPRPRTAHKGQHGDVLIVGGGIGMAGAARLAGEAALRCGAGRVTVATHPDNVAAIVGGRPELMCRGVREAAELDTLIKRADVLAIGPGLGQDEWSQAMWHSAIAAERPAVVDADALNLLARLRGSRRPRSNWILTPHPGEAARLLQMSTAEVQGDRLGAACALVREYGGVVVLKGSGSIVACGDALPSICDRGNPGMAAPGMGDVLTGVIAGIAAQISDLADAARAGVLAHAMAGDRAASRGERGIIASDLFEQLTSCVNPCASPYPGP